MAFVVRRCRELDTAGLEERKEAWQKCGVRVTVAGQSTPLADIKTVRPDYRDIHSQVLQDVLTRLDRAFQAFFRRLKNSAQPGYPRFHGERRSTRCTSKQVGNGATLDNGFLVLSQLGRIAVRWSRPIEGTVKTVTLSREADGWYACCSCAEVPEVPEEPLPRTGNEPGSDVGLKVFLITADGEVGENPRHYRKAERALRKVQRRLARRKQGSHRRKKAVKLLAKAQQKVRRQRQDFHHKTALALLQHYDVISLEDVRVANMGRNPPLAKSISDARWAPFRTLLAGTAVDAGRRVGAVPPAFTSQDCSGISPDGSPCPERIQTALSVRTHVCPRCGLVLDRDANAATNILRLGKKGRGAGQAPQALTWADAPSVA